MNKTKNLKSSETRLKETWLSRLDDKCETNGFKNYLAGLTDGDGCFNIYTRKGEKNQITLTYKLSLTEANKQLLHIIKKNIGYGTVTKKADKDGMIHYTIKNQKGNLHLIELLCGRLRTSKKEDLELFKTAYMIWLSENFSQKEKIDKINEFKSNSKLKRCSTIYSDLDKTKITTAWVVGFIEAEGSFYIVKKSATRYCHGFGVTQKLDKKVLEEILEHIGIKNVVRWNRKGFWQFDLYSKNDLKLIKKFFFKKLKGISSFYYRVWSRSFRDKQNYPKLKQIQSLLRS